MDNKTILSVTNDAKTWTNKIYTCKECDARFMLAFKLMNQPSPKYCPICGKKVTNIYLAGTIVNKI